MKKALFTIWAILFLIILGCTPTNSVADNNKWKPSYSLHAGIASGGIIENTNLKQIPNTETDAFTGATSISPTVGAHVKLPVFKNEVETGLDYMYTNQKFTFKDNVNGYNGERKLATSQLIVPITYNFRLLQKMLPGAMCNLKFGFVGEFNFVNVSDNNANLPSYSIKNFSKGFVFGLNSVPFNLSNGSKIGLYVDLYRGTRIYTDFYNLESFDMPASSFAKIGVFYQFK